MDEIQKEPIENPTQTVIIKSGYLYKRSKYLKIWKHRFIVLTNKNIFAFTHDDKDSDCTMTLLLKSCNIVKASDEELGKEHTFSVTDDERSYFLQAQSNEDRDEWITAINSQITKVSESSHI